MIIKVPIDIIMLIRPVASYRFDDIVERITKDTIPRFFSLQQPGGNLWQGEILLAVVCAPGVRNARLIRLSRGTGSGGILPEKLEFAADEVPIVGTIEIGPETLPSSVPFPTPGPTT